MIPHDECVEGMDVVALAPSGGWVPGTIQIVARDNVNRRHRRDSPGDCRRIPGPCRQ